MKKKIIEIKSLLKNNKKVVENYFFMTILQILNSLFYLLIYPFLIRTMGAESYGLYIFAMSIVTYFITFVNFGFEMPAVKMIAQNAEDNFMKSTILSNVLSAKIYLEILAILIFAIVLYAIPTLRVNWIIFSLCFIQTLTSIFFPQWYFQGIQKMRIVTYIQLFYKILSLPLIFILISKPSDIWIFVLITSSTGVFGAITSWLILKFQDKLTFKLASPSEVKRYYKEAFPFFLTTSTGVIKEQSIVVIIGAFLGMRDVAIFDLANKIIMVPRTLLVSVNGALFPKIIANVQTHIVKKIIRYEAIIGVLVILVMLVFGKWVVIFMGGLSMLQSYPIAVILSITVLVWLVVGSYNNFVFIPQNKNYFITKNQFVAMFSFFLFCFVGLTYEKSVYVLAISIALSGLTEIAYCKYLIKKHNLL
jgi:PST family polysaccharide transporter